MKVVIDWHQPAAGFNGPAAVWRNPTKPDGFGKGVRVENAAIWPRLWFGVAVEMLKEMTLRVLRGELFR
jgi:hypothetical protein